MAQRKTKRLSLLTTPMQGNYPVISVNGNSFLLHFVRAVHYIFPPGYLLSFYQDSLHTLLL